RALVVERIGDQVLSGPTLAIQQYRGGFARCYARHEAEDIQHGCRFGNHQVRLRRRRFGGVPESGHFAGELTVVEYLASPHRHQAPHTGTKKISRQLFPSISSEDMPKSFSAAVLTPVMRESGSYRTRASVSWLKTDSKMLVLHESGANFDIACFTPRIYKPFPYTR